MIGKQTEGNGRLQTYWHTQTHWHIQTCSCWHLSCPGCMLSSHLSSLPWNGFSRWQISPHFPQINKQPIKNRVFPGKCYLKPILERHTIILSKQPLLLFSEGYKYAAEGLQDSQIEHQLWHLESCIMQLLGLCNLPLTLVPTHTVVSHTFWNDCVWMSEKLKRPVKMTV